MSREETIYTLKNNNIISDKDLGQNFLADDDILEKISDAGKVKHPDIILEIGPGTGALTEKLKDKAEILILVEIDPRLYKILEKKYKDDAGIILINDDSLEIDYKNFPDNLGIETGDKKIMTVSNLPYYLTTQIITKLVCDFTKCSEMIFTIQKEAAEKIASEPGSKNFSVISALVQYYYETEVLFDISPESFIPKPNVVSSVIRMTRRIKDQPENISSRDYLKVLKASFSKRRKTLINSLGGSGIVNGGKEQAEKILSCLEIDKKTRPQEVSADKYMEIAKKIIKA